MLKKILILVVLILLVFLPTAPVHAADLVGSCETLLKGSWNGSVCTIPTGNTGEVPSGVSLGVALGQTIVVNGTLNINGELNLQGGTLSNNATTNNNGTINNYSPPTAQQYGLKNYGTFKNNGSIQIFENTALYNYGVLINADTIAATLNLKGEFHNLYASPYSGAFTNKALGLINITVNGAYLADQFTSTTNYGEIKIDSTNARIDVYSLTNHGTINNLGGTFQAVDLTNSSTGILYNDIYSNLTCGNSDWSKLDNEGSFTNRYYLNINHKCVFTNKIGGTFINSGITYIGETDVTIAPSGTLLNQGSVNNTGQIILMGWGVNSGVRLYNDNGGVITNGSGSVIELGTSTKMFNTGLIEHRGAIQPGPDVSGTLENYRWESPWSGDPGVINKYCAGTISVPYFGNAPIDKCVGTIIIKKDTDPNGPTDFSFNGGLGTFSLDDDADGTLPNERTFSGLAPGSYSVTEAATTGFSLTSLVCTSTEETGDTTAVNVSTRTATIDLDGDINETVTCTFTNTANCTPPAVTTQPVSQAITYGSNVSFIVAGTNYTSIQWQVNSGSGWSNIAGATSTTYTLTKPAVSLSGSQYRAVLTGSCTPTATSNAATLTINKAPVTATAGSYSGTYDGTAHSPSACAVTGTYTGDLSCTNSPASVGPGVGTGIISPVMNGTELTNYTITSVNGSWSITAAPVTATVTIWDKGYDGTTAASIFMCMLNGVESSDSVTCDFSSASANFDNKNVGEDKLVSVTGLTLSGASAGNYSFSGTGSDTASILALPIHGSFTADDKVYDGTTAATVHSRSLSFSVSGDDVSLEGGTATFSDKEVGTDKTVTLTGASLGGTDAGNYILEYVTPTSADIQAATLTASITAENKTYDGTTNATLTGCMLTGVVNGENVTCDYASVLASFADKNVGEDKLVSATGLILSGTDISNYSFVGTGSGTASITAIHITGNFTVTDKVYDGTTAATMSSYNLNGMLSGDDVSLVGTATFSDKNVGTDKTVTLTGATLTGIDAGNYILDSVTPTIADIQAATMTAIITVSNKVYDGLTDAVVVSCSLNGLLSGDDVVCIYSSTISASFTDKNVGTGKTVTITGVELWGTDAKNYMLDSPVTTTADITQRLINVNPVSGQFKIYGDDDPTLKYAVDDPGLATGDSFTGALSRNSGEDVGFYDIILGTLSINDGNDGANYNLGFTNGVEFETKPKHITGSFTAKDKVYDGTTAATVTLRELSGVLGEDSVSLSGGTATFSDKNVGVDKTVTLTGASLIGTDAGNYVLDSVATTTANISKRFIIVRPVSGQFKIYGNDDPTLTYTVDEPGLVEGDSLIGVLSRNEGETVGFFEITQGTLSINDGNGGINYQLGFTIEVEFQIKPKAITGSFTADDKVYDGTTAATVHSLSLSGAIDGDDVSLVGGTATFSDKNVGTDKTVTLTSASLSGTDAGNYVLDSVAITTADISVRDIYVRPSLGQFKIYGDADPTLIYTVDAPGLATGDAFTGTLSRNSGEDVGYYEITTGMLTINDGNNGENYNFWFGIEVEFEIKAKHITGSFTADDKVYDGKTAATVLTRSLSDALSGDDVSLVGGTATFSDKNVGTDKIVTLSGASLGGTDAGNYVLDSVASTTADIAAANPTCSINGYTGVYDGEPHGALGSCSGVDSEILAGLDLDDPFTNVPGGTAYWTFTDETGNYNNDSGSVDITITKATPTCLISGSTGVYDGDPHGASGSCTGVMGEVLTTLDLGAAFTDVPGGNANWTFTDETGNYNDDSGSVEIVISKADPTCSISGYTGVYDDIPHGASGSCTGVMGEILSTLDFGESFTDVPGGTANWTFTDNSGNYNDDAGSAKIVITQATLIITPEDQTAQYSDTTPPLTFSYSGFIGSEGPDDLTTKPSCSTTRAIMSPVGDYSITCSDGEDNNYTFSYVDGTFTVTKENATVTFDEGNPAALQVSTPGGTLAANALTLVLKVREKVLDFPLDRAEAGDINNAGLTVKLEPLSGGGAIMLDCTAVVEGNGYDGVKTFTCTNSAPLAVDTYDVIALVDGNYYIGEGYDVLTVYDPSLGFATGGGWFYWPGTTEKTTFGFTMKYNKKAKNVQGNLLIVRHHADGTISRLKSNALDGLALKDSNGCGIATFSGKATYMTWDPEAYEGLGGYVNTGGIPFSVYVEDCNQPGAGVDRFWVRSVDKLVMAKPASTNAVTIGGGNIVVPHKPK